MQQAGRGYDISPSRLFNSVHNAVDLCDHGTNFIVDSDAGFCSEMQHVKLLPLKVLCSRLFSILISEEQKYSWDTYTVTQLHIIGILIS